MSAITLLATFAALTGAALTRQRNASDTPAAADVPPKRGCRR